MVVPFFVYFPLSLTFKGSRSIDLPEPFGRLTRIE